MSTLSSIRILLVDDDPWVRPSLRLIVESVPRFKIVAEASGAEEALQHLRSDLEVDLALVDLRMRGINGIKLTEHICTEFPHVAVMILSNEDREEYIREAKKIGARGYLLKETPWPKIVSTIENIIDNPSGEFISQDINIEQSTVSNQRELVPERLLTPRELQVLWLIGDGLLSKQIARVLKKKSEPQEEISERTVEEHRRHIRQKFGIPRQSQHRLINIATDYRKHHKKPGNNDD